VRIMVLGIRGMPNIPGGIETHAEQLYLRLSTLGCSVEALVRSPFVASDVRSYGSIQIRRLWSPRVPRVEAFLHSLVGVLYAGIARPDILHIHGVGPAVVTPIARLLGLRVVVTHHSRDYEREKFSRFARWVLRQGERVGMRYSHARIAVSKAIADLVLAQYGQDSYVIPNGVAAVEPSTDTEHVRRFGLEPGRYFLLVSRMDPGKRQLDLIRAFTSAQIRGWKLALVGSLDNARYSQQVRTAAAEAGVVLTGYLRGEPLRQLYSHAGAFVLPSAHEGLPIALLEALSYGLPVLASNIPGNLELALDSSNYFQLGDTAALASRLGQLAQRPVNDRERRAVRLSIARRYDWGRIAMQTLQVYRAVTGNTIAVSGGRPDLIANSPNAPTPGSYGADRRNT
jgi:glycosyltransferase involved in cell wall biosynthesis